MVTTVQQVLYPFFIMCSIIGLDFYPRKQQRIQWIVNLSILYSLTIWFTYVYLLYHIMTFFTFKIRFIIFTLESNTFTSIMSVIMSRYHQKRLKIYLKKLADVDDTLEELGTPKMYRKMHTWSKRMIIGWIMYSLIINFYESFWWLKVKEIPAPWPLYMSHILNFSIHINMFVDLSFISFLWYIGTRFDKVNEHMKYLLVREEHKLRCTWKKPMVVPHRYTFYTDNYKRTLWILMHLHLELCRLVRELNLIFGTQMTFEMASFLVFLAPQCYHLCQMIMRQNRNKIFSIYDWFSFSLWLSSILSRLYIVNYMCESISLKANKIDKIIHKLTSTLRYANVWKEICQFTLQVKYHRVKFTGMGLFYFGNSFFRKFCMTIVTFVIIMMQFDIPLQQFTIGTTIIMSMVTTMEQAIRPLFLTSHVLGLGVHIPGKLYLSIFCNVTLWSAYSYLFYYVVIALKVEKFFLVISTVINNGINFFISIISIIMSLYQHKRLLMFIKRLAAVDDTLEELGTFKIYQKLHICVKRVIIGWLVVSQIANVNDMIWWFRIMNSYWCMIIPYITNHFQHINMFVDLIFTIYLWYIGNRFDKLNEHMRCLLLREKHGVRYTWKKAVRSTRRYVMCINNYKRVLWTIMHLHLELRQLARELNAMFEIQMTIEMIGYLMFLTRLFRYTLIHIITNDKFISSYMDWIDIYFWVFLYVARLFCLNYVCEDVSTKSNEMNIIIHRLTDPLRYADIRDEIYQFTLQIIHRPLKFSGLGLFYFGNGFLRNFVMTILMFMIIVIQMPGESKEFMGF